MLDLAHGLVLRAVADDPDGDHESPALDTLRACGFVVRDAAGLRITDAGRVALAAGVPSRFERLALRVVAVCLVFLALAWVGEHAL